MQVVSLDCVTVTVALLPQMILLSDHLCCVLLPHSTYFIRQFLVLVLYVGYCFGEIMCVRDSYGYHRDSYGYRKVVFVFFFLFS